MAFEAIASTSAQFDAALTAYAANKAEGGIITVTAPINRTAKTTLTSSHTPGSGKLRIVCEPGAFLGSWEPITGWSSIGGGLYQADIGAGRDFTQLWSDDEFRPIQQSRWRDNDQAIPDQLKYVTWVDPHVYVPGAAFDGVADPTQCSLMIVRAWCVARHTLSEVVAGSGGYAGKWRCTMGAATSQPEWLSHASGFPLHGTMQACRVLNAPEHITEPGDWSYNRTTGLLTIKGWDDTPNAAAVEALGICRPGAVETLLEINNADDIDLSRAVFKRTGWATLAGGCVFWNGFGGYFTSPSGSLVFNRCPAVVSVLRGNRITLRGIEIAWFEAGALDVGSVSAGGGKDIVFKGCAVHNGGRGILADHTASRVDEATEAQIPERIHVDDSLFWNLGSDIGGGAVWLAGVRDARITNCHSVETANSAFQGAQGGRFTSYWNQGLTIHNCIADDALTLCVDHGVYYAAGNLTFENRMDFLPEGYRGRRANLTNSASYGAMKRGWEGVLGHTPAIYYDEGSTATRVAGFYAQKDSRRNPGLAAALRAEYDAAGIVSPTAPSGAGVVINENGAKFCEYKRIQTVGYDEEDGDKVHSVSYSSMSDRADFTAGAGTSADPARWQIREWIAPTLVESGPTDAWFDGGDLTSQRKAVSSLSAVGTTATVTFASALSGQFSGMAVIIRGANEAEWNGVWRDVVFTGSTTAIFEVPGGMTTPATGTITIAPYWEAFDTNWPFEAVEDVFTDGIVPADNTWPINTLASLSALTDVGPETEVEVRKMGLSKATRERWSDLLDRAGITEFYP